MGCSDKAALAENMARVCAYFAKRDDDDEARQLVTRVGECAEFMGSLLASQEAIADANASMAELYIELEDAKDAVEQREKVLARAHRTIKDMMKAMHQGLFTVGRELVVGEAYSDKLESILGTSRIAGRKLDDLLFEGATVSADARACTLASAALSIGCDSIFFDVNAHALIGEIHRRGADGVEQVLELDWGRIVAEDDTVERIMVSVRDVTELHALRSKADELRAELVAVGELLAIDPVSYGWLERELGALSLELAAHLDAIPSDPASAYRAILGLLHTVKGGARNHALARLCDATHAAETRVASARDAMIPWCPPDVRAAVRSVVDAISGYLSLGREQLGRGRAPSGATLPAADEALHRVRALLEAEDASASASELREIIARVRAELAPGGVRLDTVCEPMVRSAMLHARELGKPEPRVEREGTDILLPPRVASGVSRALTHLFSNAVAHGIEAAEQRRAAGKPSQPTISVAARRTSSAIEVVFQDDGAGIDLRRVREKLRDRGLASIAEASPLEVANSLFDEHISTAAAVTTLAGRGAGMGAIRDAVRGVGGALTLELVDPREDGAAFRVHARFPL